jgi:hypothetical protein
VLEKYYVSLIRDSATNCGKSKVSRLRGDDAVTLVFDDRNAATSFGVRRRTVFSAHSDRPRKMSIPWLNYRHAIASSAANFLRSARPSTKYPFDRRSRTAGSKTDTTRQARNCDRGRPRGWGSLPGSARAGGWRNSRRTSPSRPACPNHSGISYDDNGNDWIEDIIQSGPCQRKKAGSRRPRRARLLGMKMA